MGSKGIVASTAALAVLLQKGIGDTIRISLTPEPNGDRTREVVVAQELLQTMGLRSFSPLVSACPGCGRTTSAFFQELADQIQTYLRAQMPTWRVRYPGVENMTVAVMGCVVNGPGESKMANIGISLPGTGESAGRAGVCRRPEDGDAQGRADRRRVRAHPVRLRARDLRWRARSTAPAAREAVDPDQRAIDVHRLTKRASAPHALSRVDSCRRRRQPLRRRRSEAVPDARGQAGPAARDRAARVRDAARADVRARGKRTIAGTRRIGRRARRRDHAALRRRNARGNGEERAGSAGRPSRTPTTGSSCTMQCGRASTRRRFRGCASSWAKTRSAGCWPCRWRARSSGPTAGASEERTARRLVACADAADVPLHVLCEAFARPAARPPPMNRRPSRRSGCFRGWSWAAASISRSPIRTTCSSRRQLRHAAGRGEQPTPPLGDVIPWNARDADPADAAKPGIVVAVSLFVQRHGGYDAEEDDSDGVRGGELDRVRQYEYPRAGYRRGSRHRRGGGCCDYEVDVGGAVGGGIVGGVIGNQVTK